MKKIFLFLVLLVWMVEASSFLALPLEGSHETNPISSFFDHDGTSNRIELFSGEIANKNCVGQYSSCQFSDGHAFNYAGYGLSTRRSDKSYIHYDNHTGIDYAVNNVSVKAAASGIVVYAGWENNSKHSQGFGKYVKIYHNSGYATYYGHLSEIDVSVGENVRTGQQIGISGNTGRSTGPHLHFEVRKGCSSTQDHACSKSNRVDPYGYKGNNVLWVDWSYDGSDNNQNTVTTTNIHLSELMSNYGGLTIITHGLNSNTDDWVQEMGLAIYNKVKNTKNTVVRVLNIAPDKGAITIYDPYYSGDNIFTFSTNINSAKDNLILLVDWGDNASPRNPLTDFGDTESKIAEMVIDKISNSSEYKKFLELPVHLIGHSRGGSVVSYIAKELGERNIVVDQLTMLDPHPMNHVIDLSSYAPKVYNNVIYSDTYYQQANEYTPFDDLGNIIGYCNNNFSECNKINGELLQDAPDGTIIKWHSAVHAYYFGTILDNLNDKYNYKYYKNNLKDDWFFNNDLRQIKGFNKTRFALYKRGVKREPNGLNSKLSVISNIKATGKRDNQNICQANSYPNIIFPSNIDGNSRASIGLDKKLNLDVITQYCLRNRDLKITLFLDQDKDPFNGIQKLASTEINSGNGDFQKSSLTLDNLDDNLNTGSYYVGAEIYDPISGNKRYDYLMQKLIVKKTTTTQQHINHPPATPSVYYEDVLQKEPSGATVSLSTSSFIDPDSGDTHWKTWWGLKKGSDHNSGRYIWHSGWSSEDKTYIALGNLDYDTTYTVDVRHMDNHGVWSSSWGSVTFTTPSAPIPDIKVDDAIDITQNEATIWSYYDTYGINNTNINVSWGKTSSFGNDTDYHIVGINEAGTTVKLKNLECGTTYYYMANIYNSRGTAHSQIKSFTTLPCQAQIKIESNYMQDSIIDLGDTEIGSCKTTTVSIVKDNNRGDGIGDVELVQNQDSAFSIVGSSNFNLKNKGDTQNIKVKLCADDSKYYSTRFQIKADNLTYKDNTDSILIQAQGVNDAGENSKTNDLYFDKVTVNDKQSGIIVNAGDKIKLYANEKYRGDSTGEVENSVGVYFFKDTIFDKHQAILIAKNNASPDNIYADGMVMYYTIPKNTPSGTYNILFVADDKNIVDEINEDNNLEYVKIRINKKNINEVDLSVESITLDKIEYQKDDKMNLSFIVKNIGNKNARASQNVFAYIGTADNLYLKQVVATSTKYALKSGEYEEFKRKIDFSNLKIGLMYYITVNIDPEKNENEGNRVNNILKSKTFKIIIKKDSDGDGISDKREIELGLKPNNNDSDADGILDSDEIGDINNPTDTDSDGIIDALDTDSDNDGISDADELKAGTNPRDPNSKPSLGKVTLGAMDDVYMPINAPTKALNLHISNTTDEPTTISTHSYDTDLVVTSDTNPLYITPVHNAKGHTQVSVRVSAGGKSDTKAFDVYVGEKKPHTFVPIIMDDIVIMVPRTKE